MSIPDNKINYVEFKAKDLNHIKSFYSKVFDWKFIDYGPSYIAFENSGLEGGFEQSDDKIVNGALIILYHKDLEQIKEKVILAGGDIAKDIFKFPGGKRFHFLDPAGNELAVWSDQ